MSMIKVKTSELTGSALDWPTFCAVYPGAAPTIEVIEPSTAELVPGNPLSVPGAKFLTYQGAYQSKIHWHPSTDWSQGGPLMEKYLSELTNDDGCWVVTCFTGFGDDIRHGFGRDFNSKLVGVCRAIVDAVLGDEVEVPQELVEVGHD